MQADDKPTVEELDQDIDIAAGLIVKQMVDLDCLLNRIRRLEYRVNELEFELGLPCQ